MIATIEATPQDRDLALWSLPLHANSLSLSWLLGAVVLGVAGCSEPAGRSHDSALLITIDTTRADRLGCYGHAAAKTPQLDALAASGFRFSRAYATAPVTLPSHVSILTGTYPCAHQVRDNAIFRLRDEARTLAEVLAEEQMETAAFVASYVVDRSFGLGQGFATYPRPAQREEGKPPVTELVASEVVDRTLTWLDSVDSGKALFVWVHFYDPHAPWTPPDEYRSRFSDLYDAEIAYCDDQIARLLQGFEARQRREDLWVVVTSDHGESLGEHGESSHGLTLYEGALRIPWIVTPPPARSSRAPLTIERPVSAAAVPATLLSLLGLDPALLPEAEPPVLVGPEGTPADSKASTVYFEAFTPFYSYRWAPQQGLLSKDQKYIRTRRSELYDLAMDPAESNNLLQSGSKQHQELDALLDEVLRQRPARGWHQPLSPGEDERERLLALGYTVGATGEVELDRPDVKDRIQTMPWIDEARGYLDSARLALGMQKEQRAQELFATAEQRITRIESVDAEGPAPAELRGRLYLYQNKKRKAVPHFERALLAMPQSAALHYMLAQCYRSTRKDWAEAEYLKVIQLEPHFTDAYRELGQLLRAQGRIGELVYLLRQLIEVHKEDQLVDPNLHTELQKMEQSMQQAGQTVTRPPFESATDLRPEGTYRD